MRKAAFLFAFLAFFAEGMAKDIYFYFNEVVFTEGAQKAQENIPEAKDFFSVIEAALIKNSLIKAKDSASADYIVKVNLDYASSRAVMNVNFKNNKAGYEPVADRVSAGDSELGKVFYDRIRDKIASLCNDIHSHESKGVNTRRSFVPGLAQWRNGYHATGVIIGVADVAALAFSGYFALKAYDSSDEADVSRKKAALAMNADDFDRYMSDAKKHDSDFKTERGIAIGLGVAFVTIYVVNIITGTYTVTSYTSGNSNVALMPMISPNGETAGLYWTMNF